MSETKQDQGQDVEVDEAVEGELETAAELEEGAVKTEADENSQKIIWSSSWKMRKHKQQII